MNKEFDESMRYQKYDNKTEKTNYRNGSTSKKAKSEFGKFELSTQEIEMENLIFDN